MTEGTSDPTKHREKGSIDLWAIPFTGFRFRVPEPTKSGNAKAEHFAHAYLKAVTTCCLLAKEYTSRASGNLSSNLTPLLYLWCVWIGCFFFFNLPWSLAAAAAAKLLQSCPTLRNPGLQPTRLLRPRGFPGKSTGVGCHCLLHDHQREPIILNIWTLKPGSAQCGYFVFSRHLLLGRKAVTNLDSILKSRDITLLTGPSSQSYGLSSSHVWMWELDYKESWASKNWCFWTVVLKKTLENPLDCKEIKPVNHKGNQSWIFIGRTDAEAETPILWPPDAKNWLLGKDPHLGKTEGRQRRGWQRVRWLNGITDLMDVRLSKLQELVQGSLWCCSL